MKTIIKKSLLIALCYYAVAISGCLEKQCNCPAIHKDQPYTFENLKTRNVIYEFKNDSTLVTNTIATDTIVKENYGLLVNFETKLACNKKSAEWTMMNKAMACDCVGQEYYPSDTVMGITIKTIEDFDASHKAGTIVNDLFEILFANSVNSKFVRQPLSRIGEVMFMTPYTSNPTPVQLHLSQYPDIAKNVQFEIQLEFQNRAPLLVKTTAVFLK